MAQNGKRKQRRKQRKGPPGKERWQGRRRRGSGFEARPKSRLIDTAVHTSRREILRRMHKDSGAQYCAADLAAMLKMPIQSVSYHFKVLEKGGAIHEVKREKVRGANRYLFKTLVDENPIITAILRETEQEDREEEDERLRREVREMQEAVKQALRGQGKDPTNEV